MIRLNNGPTRRPPLADEPLAPPLQVKVLFAGQDIDRSPFIVNVSKAMGDPTRVQARGPGLQQTGNVAGKPTYFDIYTAGNEMAWKRVHTWTSSRAGLGPSGPARPVSERITIVKEPLTSITLVQPAQNKRNLGQRGATWRPVKAPAQLASRALLPVERWLFGA